MRGWRKGIAWVAVFALAAVAGAFVAAHSDPFPPGVEEPGTPASPTSSSRPESWTLVMTSRAVHELHVGGTCQSRWRTAGVLVVTPDGKVTGTGRGLAQGRASCSFATAQVPAHAVELEVSGHVTGTTMVLVLHTAGAFEPAGSLDLGGFTNVLPVLRLSIEGTSGSGARAVSRPDGDRGRYRSHTQAHVRCLSCGRT